MSGSAPSRINLGDTELHVVEKGSGVPVVFVHGGLSDYRVWTPQVAALGERYRAIAYSRRFHYPNSPIPPGEDDQMAPHVRDLAALLRKIGAAPAHIVGDSWGAFIALRLGIESPELVKSLSLAEPPVLPLLHVSIPPSPWEVIRLFLQQPATALSFVRFGAGYIAPATKAFRHGDAETGMRTFLRGVLGAHVAARLPLSRLEQARQNVAPLAAELLGNGFEPLHDADVRSIDTPTLLIEGEQTRALFRRLNRRLADLIPNCTLLRVPNASHSPHDQNPTSYNESLLRFLDTVSPASLC